MVKIAVCDDDRYARKDIKDHLLEYSMSNEFEYTVDEYDSGEGLLMSGKKYDLIFMDYQFKDGREDGIRIAGKLREKNDDVTIIFLSSYPEAVFDSFEVGAFRFLVKPIDKEKFTLALDKFSKYMLNDCVIKLHEVGKNRSVNKHDILFLEGHGKKCILHFADRNKDFECNKTLSSVEEIIDDDTFYRCQKSYVINLAHISGYNHSAVTMDNGSVVLISRNKYREFMEKYGAYILKRKTFR